MFGVKVLGSGMCKAVCFAFDGQSILLLRCGAVVAVVVHPTAFWRESQTQSRDTVIGRSEAPRNSFRRVVVPPPETAYITYLKSQSTNLLMCILCCTFRIAFSSSSAYNVALRHVSKNCGMRHLVVLTIWCPSHALPMCAFLGNATPASVPSWRVGVARRVSVACELEMTSSSFLRVQKLSQAVALCRRKLRVLILELKLCVSKEIDCQSRRWNEKMNVKFERIDSFPSAVV
jgi:hypothetical protein